MIVSAAVPELTPIECTVPQYSAKSASNCATSLPRMNSLEPSNRSNASVSRSASGACVRASAMNGTEVVVVLEPDNVRACRAALIGPRAARAAPCRKPTRSAEEWRLRVQRARSAVGRQRGRRVADLGLEP